MIFSLAIYKKYSLQSKVAGLSTSSEQKQIKGIILPHHELAKEYIISSLEKISQSQNFTHIVVIGPNHFQLNATQFVSTTSLFNYPISEKQVYKLKEIEGIILNTKIIEKEHSITIPASYLNKYFPEAKFIFLVVPSFFERSKISQIAEFLKENLPPETLYVASVDFSHGKMLLEAMEKNNETEEALRNFDYEKIYQFKDDHLDSPASIGLLMNLMSRIGATNWELWYNSHGAVIENKYNLQGTSYLIGVFFK